MKRFRSTITILCLVTLSSTIPAEPVSGTSDLRFYAFYEYYCPGCAQELTPLMNAYGEDRVVIFDVREGDNGERYAKITDLIVYLDLPVVGVFKNNSLTAILSGLFMEDDWRKIVETEYDGVPVYAKRSREPIRILKEKEVTSVITELFIEETTEDIKGIEIHVPSFLPILLAAAALDAVNPCELYVLTVLLTLVFFTGGKRLILRIGVSFAIGMFTAYYLMGFGLVQLIAYTPQVRYAVAVLGLLLGARAILGDTIASFLGKKFKSVPEVFSKKLSAYLRKASSNPVTAFAVGIMSAAFLSPCTSGPYFIALSLIASLENQAAGLLLLTIYNIIFVAPAIAITLAVYTLRLTTRGLKKWASKERRWMDIIAGLLMIVLSVYLIFYYIPMGSLYT